MAEYKTKTSLAIYSTTRSLPALEELLGVTPSWVIEKGEPVSKRPGAAVRALNGVFLEAGPVPAGSLPDSLDELLRAVAPNADAIRAYAENEPPPDSRGWRTDSPVVVQVTVFSETPIIANGFELSTHQIALLATLGASFGVELYVGE